VLLPWVIEFNFDAAAESYRSLARALGADVASAPEDEVKQHLLERVAGLQRSCEACGGLAAAGVEPTRIPELARRAYGDICIVTNPRVPTLRDLEEIYERAL
jgi:alcohol dehydrogenase class IV